MQITFGSRHNNNNNNNLFQIKQNYRFADPKVMRDPLDHMGHIFIVTVHFMFLSSLAVHIYDCIDFQTILSQISVLTRQG